jgi:hypothetical protein
MALPTTGTMLKAENTYYNMLILEIFNLDL